MTLPSLSEADNLYKRAHNLYREYVRRSLQKYGSFFALAEYLGIPESTVKAIVYRDRITTLRKLAMKIHKRE